MLDNWRFWPIGTCIRGGSLLLPIDKGRDYSLFSLGCNTDNFALFLVKVHQLCMLSCYPCWCVTSSPVVMLPYQWQSFAKSCCGLDRTGQVVKYRTKAGTTQGPFHWAPQMWRVRFERNGTLPVFAESGQIESYESSQVGCLRRHNGGVWQVASHTGPCQTH